MANMNPVRAARTRLGLTQEGLAEKVGVTQVTISDIESGRTSSPSYGLVVRLAKALKVKPDALFPIEVGK